MSSRLGLFLTEQQVCTLCYRTNCNLLFLIVTISTLGAPDFRGKDELGTALGIRRQRTVSVVSKERH